MGDRFQRPMSELGEQVKVETLPVAFERGFGEMRLALKPEFRKGAEGDFAKAPSSGRVGEIVGIVE